MEWEPRVLSADYSFVYFDGVNRFYLANEHAEMKKHFTSPPNVFDEFETFPLVRARTDAEQRLEAMHKLERFIQERDAVIKESGAVIKERDAVIKERDAVIKERDAVIKERDAVIKERDAVIKERDAVIEERDAVIKERDAVIKERDAVTSGIFNSRIWKLTHPKWLARFRVSMR